MIILFQTGIIFIEVDYFNIFMLEWLRKTFGLTSICVVCQKYQSGIYVVCRYCYLSLREISFPCRCCARPMLDDQFKSCIDCQRVAPDFDQVLTSYQYEGALRQLLHQYKYYRNLYVGHFLVKLMVDAIEKNKIKTECLIPVPLHPKKIRERGFNQSAELAKLLSKQLNVPYESKICKKILHTPAQVTLSPTERRRNLLTAFRVNPTSYRSVTLVDDVVTTGSTINELAGLLKEQGVTRVSVVCCARAF